MDLKNLEGLENAYSSTEVRIIIDYFSGKSIRQLAIENKRFGRDKKYNSRKNRC